MKKYQGFVIIGLLTLLMMPLQLWGQRQMEKLDRGLSVINSSGSLLVSWRIFGDDDANIAFNVYASTSGKEPVLVNSTPISGKSNYLASGLSIVSKMFIKPVVNGVEGEASKSVALKSANPFWSIPLDIPAGGKTPDSVSYTYSANDCSVGDVDGDGDYEIIMKWDPSNSKDNAHSGHTGNVFLDAYTLEGTKLWRIDLGKNIRAGAHYTQFMVYDLDGDGKAEIACKTAPGTKDATGSFLSSGPAKNAVHTKDYRNSSGRVLAGPEYLTVFNGETGAEMVTIYYNPRRHPSTENPSGAQMKSIWGDDYGNRVDRFLACIAYLDGVKPSLVMCRGYYTRTVLAAYDFNDGELTERWVFDSSNSGNSSYRGQGNHGLSVNDVDGDGKDEIVYGAMTINDDGTGLYTTGLGHGDALHVSDLDPTREGLEVFSPHESGGNGVTFRDAKTGKILWQHKKAGADVGRGVAFDVDPNYSGAECWASDGAGIYASTTGEVISTTYPATAGNGTSFNMAAWWDGDVMRELIDRSVITKWNWDTKSTDRVLSTYNYDASSNNGSKSNPCLIADIWGDWREELLYKTGDSKELRIFSTTHPSDHGFYSLMHDPQYRLSIAWQNVAYNQPAHTSYFLGHNMATPPVPNAYYIDASTSTAVDSETMDAEMLIYPNPMSNFLYIKHPEAGINSVILRSLSGKILYEQGNPTSNAINVSFLTSGVYIVEVNSSKGTWVQKVIKY